MSGAKLYAVLSSDKVVWHFHRSEQKINEKSLTAVLFFVTRVCFNFLASMIIKNSGCAIYREIRSSFLNTHLNAEELTPLVLLNSVYWVYSAYVPLFTYCYAQPMDGNLLCQLNCL